VNATLLATAELLGALCGQYAYEKIGRKTPYIISMCLSGVILFTVYFLPECKFGFKKCRMDHPNLINIYFNLLKLFHF
jgi:hypothetical protein